MLKLDYWAQSDSLAWSRYQPKLNEIHNKLNKKQDAYTGWVDWPLRVEPALIQEILDTAEEIRQKCTALVVIGIGGSYLGAKACIELLQSPFYNEHNAEKMQRPRIYFAGHHLSAIYYTELLERLNDEEVCLCVISKSGTTLEPSIAFELLRGYVRERYGLKEAAKRIYAITDASKGTLRAEADEQGYKTFVVPDDIGGRYSVLTPVGLLPIAVAGIDIVSMLEGAAVACRACNNADLTENICYQYGLLRYLLQQQGKVIEIFEVYEGRLRYFTEWLKQLFGESECKAGKGVIPMSLQMSTDLHSMGQFLQDGRQMFFETVLTIGKIRRDVSLEGSAYAGKAGTMHELNQIVEESARKAHLENGTPNIRLTVSELSARSFGYMVYFFEKACAVSCYLTGVNPFDQPGVEAYKSNIKAALKGNI
ncbi:MAG: glucose-6-phosphate isomerase [Peptococcaceae bacterium]|nr:glucose-6-phosphate isomerase [Peptococcaceae bacterium]